MSFERSIERLVYYKGSSLKCAGSRVDELWSITQGEQLQRVEFSKQANEPVENWAQWLAEADTSPAASLKVLVIRTEPIPPYVAHDKLLVREAERLRELFESVKLPAAGLGAYLQSLAQYSCIPTAGSAEPGTCSFFFSDPTVGWTWSYCPKTRSTRAILLSRDVKTNYRPEECRVILERNTEFVDQPLLLSYLCTETMGSRACGLIGNLIVPEVLQIERSTGLETWNPAGEEVLDKVDRKSGEEDNLKAILYSQRVTDLRFRLAALLDYVPIVRRHNQRHTEFLRTQKESEYLGLNESIKRSLLLDEVMATFHDYLKVRLLKAESLTSRISAQVVAVEKLQALKRSLESQLIAQDSKRIAEDSHLLAKEGTRDSKGMMTIAVVTMVFLPGTFIAAFFAMPIFQWDAVVSNDVVNSRIWIYWAVTVPLTLIVLGIWTLYRFFSDRREKTEDIELAGRSYRHI